MSKKAHVMQTLHTNPTVVRFDFDYKKASEVTKKAHAMQPLHTNPTVVRFDFYYKKASEVTTNAQEELESVHPPLLQTRAMFVLFYTIKLDSYLLLPQLSPNAAEGQLHRNRIAKPNHTSREICFIVTPFRDTKSNDKRKEISCGVSR